MLVLKVLLMPLNGVEACCFFICLNYILTVFQFGGAMIFSEIQQEWIHVLNMI